MRRVVRGWARALELFETYSLIGGVLLLAAISLLNVIARTFFTSIYFAEEISEFLVIFITFTGIGYGAKEARHIRMGAVQEFLPAQLEKALIMIAALASAAVMFTMAWHSCDYLLEVREMGQTTAALRLPYWTFLVIVPIGFSLAGIQYLLTLVRNLKEPGPWLSYSVQSEYDQEVI